MEMRVVGFIPPIIGVEGSFNTLRLGLFYHKNLSINEEVLLLNEKDRLIFGRAIVERLEVGQLGEMCLLHGATNHTQLAEDSARAAERLFAIITKIYGPHVATPTKKCVVIFLRRIE